MEYHIWSDLHPDTVTEIGLAIYAKWLAFAMGKESLNGNRIKHPTGRYASALFFKQESPTKVAIFVDEGLAPEAEILEHGHRAIDLKRSSLAGRAIPLHRGEAGVYGSKGYGPPILTGSPADRAGNIWAIPKAQGFTGIKRVPSGRTRANASSWVIPKFTPYAPAKILAQLFQNELK
jgi:hypothetical protein